MIIKFVHIACVFLTFCSFSLRCYWVFTDSPVLQRKATKIIPHIIDTVLLASGVLIAVNLYEEFYRQPWLLNKFVAVIVYIILGSIVINYGKTKTVRKLTCIGAYGVFFYIIAIAIYKFTIFF